MSILSEHLRELRGAQSQAAMADPLGIKYQQWAKYERGEVAPGAEILAKICRVHAVSADWLLGLDKKSSSTAIASGKNSLAIVGSNNSIATPGEDWRCSKCPIKKKLRALEKVLSK